MNHFDLKKKISNKYFNFKLNLLKKFFEQQSFLNTTFLQKCNNFINNYFFFLTFQLLIRILICFLIKIIKL